MKRQLQQNFDSEIPSMVYNPRETEVITIDDDEPSVRPAIQRSNQVDERRRQKPVVDNKSPKAPLTAYLRFMTEHREAMRVAEPHLSFPEITKLLGVMWDQLPAQKKKVYIDDAERERLVYVKELTKYQQSDTYKQFVAQQEAERTRQAQQLAASQNVNLICRPCKQGFRSVHDKNEHLATKRHQTLAQKAVADNAKTQEPVSQPQTSTTTNVKVDIMNSPVFSKEFMQYNRDCESEFRKLKKATNILEEENAILSQQCEKLKAGISKLEDESRCYEDDVALMEPFLKRFNSMVVEKFACLAELPCGRKLPELTEDSVEDYLKELCAIKEEGSDKVFITKVDTILASLNYPECVQ